MSDVTVYRDRDWNVIPDRKVIATVERGMYTWLGLAYNKL
jgi:hypothetical protein